MKKFDDFLGFAFFVLLSHQMLFVIAMALTWGIWEDEEITFLFMWLALWFSVAILLILLASVIVGIVSEKKVPKRKAEMAIEFEKFLEEYLRKQKVLDDYKKLKKENKDESDSDKH